MGHLLHFPALALLSGAAFVSWRGEVISKSWFPMLLTLSILYVVAILWMVYAMDEQEKTETEESVNRMKQRRVGSWETLFSHHNHLVQQFASMTRDERMRILYPEILNQDSDLFRNIEQEQRLALTLRPSAASDTEYARESAYYRTVQRLEEVIKAYVENAKSIGWDKLTPQEKLKQSLSLEAYYKKQEANNQPLRGQSFSLIK